MRCSKCGSENPSGRKFCGECGDPFAVKCPRCGAANTAPFKFCGECGATLGAASAASTIRAEPESSAIRVSPEAGAQALEGERKTVTALFADIKGSYTQGLLHGIWWLRVSISEPSSAVTGTVGQLRRVD
jgi:hypothetical protein